MIRLNVFIQVSAENRTAVLESAKELVAYSLKDNGCIAYDVFESATRSDVLMICETWKDAESLSAHEKADHFVTVIVLPHCLQAILPPSQLVELLTELPSFLFFSIFF